MICTFAKRFILIFYVETFIILNNVMYYIKINYRFLCFAVLVAESRVICNALLYYSVHAIDA